MMLITKPTKFILYLDMSMSSKRTPKSDTSTGEHINLSSRVCVGNQFILICYKIINCMLLGYTYFI